MLCKYHEIKIGYKDRREQSRVLASGPMEPSRETGLR